MKDNTSLGYTINVGTSEWKFFGKWYKPWTWLRWSKIYTINEFKLWDFSFISNPTDPNTVMKIEDNDK